MTESRNDKTDKRLETLYQRDSDIEPDAGLDRIIRARAAESVHASRSSVRPAWLGGVVTAAVAIVAVTVVLQQTPPGDPAADSLIPQESAEPEAFMAPSMGAQPEAATAGATSDSTLERVTVTGSRITADEEAPESSETLIEKLQALIENERFKEARRLAEEAAELDPELSLPDEIRQALRRVDSQDPDAGANHPQP